MKLETLIAEFVTTMESPGEGELMEVKRSILNGIGVTIGAARHPTVEMLLELSIETGGKEQATVLGRGLKTDVYNAALMNGFQCHLFDFDDTHLDTIIHPTSVILPVVLALGEWKQYSGREIVEAFLVGTEVSIRIGESIYPSHYDIGWHTTGTTGVIGAAAAAGRLLKLDVEQTVYAIGIAVQHSSGLKEMFGTMCKPLSPGKAARDGIFAALLAKKGFTSSTNSLEAKRGFMAVYSNKFDRDHIYNHLGKSFAILENSYKPYACGIVIHPIIDGVIAIRNEHNVDVSDIKAINAEIHPLVLETTGKLEPKTGLEGKFSTFHCAAVGYIDGFVGEEQFTDERVNDGSVIELRRKVNLNINNNIRENESIVSIELNSGTIYSEHVEFASGSKERPLTDQQLEAKFIHLTNNYLSKSKQQDIIKLVSRIEELEQISTLIDEISLSVKV